MMNRLCLYGLHCEHSDARWRLPWPIEPFASCVAVSSRATHRLGRLAALVLTLIFVVIGMGCEARSTARASESKNTVELTVGVTTTDGKTTLIKSLVSADKKDDQQIAIINAVDLGDGQVEVQIEAMKPIVNLMYPIAAKQRTGRYTVLSPFKMGQRIPSNTLKEWGWRGLSYPGPLFAPMLIVEQSRQCELLYATDWPPRQVKMFYSLGREALSMPIDLKAGERTTVRYRRVTALGDWRQATDVYREYVDEKIRNLPYYRPPPEWMVRAHGYLNIQLENIYRFDIRYIDRFSETWRDVLPWVQFWGQMSHHVDRGKALGEEVGCCSPKQGFHPRYQPELSEWVRQKARDDYQIGFYSRPDPEKLLVVPEGIQYLNDWQTLFRQSCGANACYVDVVGMGYFGPVLEVGRVLAELPIFPMIEGADIYLPFAYMISGAYQIDDPFPEFGRYLLNDRLVFLGGSNGGHRDWGSDHVYRQEIRAFLLGAKFDAIHPNAVMREIANVRDRVDWWGRAPKFIRIEDSVMNSNRQAAVFVDRNGVRLVASVEVDRWMPSFSIRESKQQGQGAE